MAGAGGADCEAGGWGLGGATRGELRWLAALSRRAALLLASGARRISGAPARRLLSFQPMPACLPVPPCRRCTASVPRTTSWCLPCWRTPQTTCRSTCTSSPGCPSSPCWPSPPRVGFAGARACAAACPVPGACLAAILVESLPSPTYKTLAHTHTHSHPALLSHPRHTHSLSLPSPTPTPQA